MAHQETLSVIVVNETPLRVTTNEELVTVEGTHTFILASVTITGTVISYTGTWVKLTGAVQTPHVNHLPDPFWLNTAQCQYIF
jgi:hypothetical protein